MARKTVISAIFTTILIGSFSYFENTIAIPMGLFGVASQATLGTKMGLY